RVEAANEEMGGARGGAGGAAADGVRGGRSLDGRLLGQSWETPFVEVGAEAITAETMPALVERFHDTYERRYGNRFPYIPVQGVSYRGELRVPSEKVEFAPLPREGGSPSHSRSVRRIALRHFSDEPPEPEEHAAGWLPGGWHR